MSSSPAIGAGVVGGKRTRKKHKRLNDIVDSPRPDPVAAAVAADLRRSSRARRPPLLLDSSPLVSDRKVKPDILQQSSIRRDREPGEWGSRLRGRGRDGESPNRLRMEDSRSPRPSWRRTRDREQDMESEHAGFGGEEEQEMEELMFPRPSRRRKRDREPETESEHAGGVGEGEQEVEHMQTAPNPIDNVAVDDHAVEVDQAPETVKADSEKPPELHVKEGRRCVLCGGGGDGRPPRKVAEGSMDSEKEAYEGASASEEPNYNTLDGFGVEPGWLGRLLGPLLDRYGIARVWVHQLCAVWSPEVYFAGLGHLKNVRAALCRGRALKCNRCGRSGATIGCRVDRCPKTYHLPCSRVDGCIFDHRKFLIACYDHRHLFQPQGNNSHQIKKMKAKKLKSDMKKLSNDAWRKDLEAEDKWLENCGEDEEFLKREGKRLQRDILRIAPVYIGGPSETGELYQGWESVAGHKDVIQCLKEVVILPLLYPEFFSSLSITPPRGVLLHGYPGTGKTLVVRALIGACSRGDKRIAYFARKGADCLGKYVGDAERQLRLLFQVAERSQPSIIFFDEIDGLAPRRSRHQDQTHCSVVSTLLSLMDGLKSRGSVIVIGATNRPEVVDPALRRPGRFDREIYFPLPSEKDRSAILSLHTRSWPNPVCGSLLSWISNQTAGYAGADLQSLCTQAAMNALKRNCALQELMSSAEKGSGYDKLPSLPSFIVEERDWLAALAFSPPPCSRRDAGSAANEIVSSPLQPHLVPCLLQPLSQLLVSFYIDERIWLPPRLFRASEFIKSVTVSALQQKKFSIVSWWSHLHYLIEEPSFAKEIEGGLSCHGLIFGPSGFGQCYADEDENADQEKFDSCQGTSRGHVHSKSLQRCHLKCGKALGFRSLISGTPRSGQTHLASCLLHGFRGHIEIHKVTLATISQEGHGDLIHGLTLILLKCLNVAPCVIYLPRIDLWAINKILGQEVVDNTMTEAECNPSPTAEVTDAKKFASEAWNSFVEQLDSACNSQSIIILATCEVQNNDLPFGIRHFFTSHVSDHTYSGSSEHSIPRFFVDLDGNFKHDQVLNSSAAKLSQDLVRHYVQLVHYRTHISNSPDKNKPSHSVEVVAERQRQNMEGRPSSANLITMADSERIASNSEASCRDNQTQHGINTDHRSVLRQTNSFKEIDIQLHNDPDFFPKSLPSKVMKGGSVLAITTFGYQILSYPQFAELCWITSKLKEGPSTTANGPWKRWPFNSCITYPSSSLGKVVDEVVCNNLKDKEHKSLVRGLVAVGLLAYRGVYTSVKEVSFEVRKVLELLVGHIHDKISSRKDRSHRYFGLLSQVAYLEDLVNSWAYTFQSLDSPTTTSNTKASIVGTPNADKTLGCCTPVDNQPSRPPYLNCNEVQEVSHQGSPQKFVDNGQCANFTNGITDVATLNSDASMVPQDNRFQGLIPPSSHPSTSRPRSSLASRKSVNGYGSSSLPRTPPSKLNALDISENTPEEAYVRNLDRSVTLTKSCSGKVRCRRIGLENSSGAVPEEPDCVSDFARPETLCHYECCSKCLQALYKLARSILSDCCRSSDRCSTLDDIHDIVASCSLNLFSAIGRHCPSQNNTESAEFSGRKKHRATQSELCACQEIGDHHHTKTSNLHKASRSKTFLPKECSCHRHRKDTARPSSERNSLVLPPLSFLFRDGVLIPSDPEKDAVFHCRFEKFCTCFILQTMLNIKQSLC